MHIIYLAEGKEAAASLASVLGTPMLFVVLRGTYISSRSLAGFCLLFISLNIIIVLGKITKFITEKKIYVQKYYL